MYLVRYFNSAGEPREFNFATMIEVNEFLSNIEYNRLKIYKDVTDV